MTKNDLLLARLFGRLPARLVGRLPPRLSGRLPAQSPRPLKAGPRLAGRLPRLPALRGPFFLSVLSKCAS